MTDYIDRMAVRNELYKADAITMQGVKIINQFPAADVVEVVRCKDCYYWTRDEDKTDGFCLCDRRTNLIEAINLMAPYTTENDYCSWGERKEDE